MPITADSKSKVVNTANPPLTFTAVGFVNGDTVSSLSTQPTLTTTATMNSLVGTYPITASGAIDANYAISYVAGTLTVTAGSTATTTTLMASPNPANAGQSVTFTAVVNSAAGVPTGTVTFMDGSTVLGTLNLSVIRRSDQATFTTSSLAAGMHAITALYSGSATYRNSASTILHETINKSATTTTLSASPSPAKTGQNVTFTAVVSSAVTGTPTGNVTFKDGSTVLGTGTLSLVGGHLQATISSSSLAAGVHSITAEYSGDAIFSSSTSSAVHEVITKGRAAAQNAAAPPDVNGDGKISPIDALIVINALNLQSAGTNDGSTSASSEDGSENFFEDVNGDGIVSAIDALRVVNFLLRSNPPTSQATAATDQSFAALSAPLSYATNSAINSAATLTMPAPQTATALTSLATLNNPTLMIASTASLPSKASKSVRAVDLVHSSADDANWFLNDY